MEQVIDFLAEELKAEEEKRTALLTQRSKTWLAQHPAGKMLDEDAELKRIDARLDFLAEELKADTAHA